MFLFSLNTEQGIYLLNSMLTLSLKACYDADITIQLKALPHRATSMTVDSFNNVFFQLY